MCGSTVNLDFSYGSLPTNLIIHIPRVIDKLEGLKKLHTSVDIPQLVAYYVIRVYLHELPKILCINIYIYTCYNIIAQ